MIKYLNSSLFLTPAQAIVNTVNTVGVMGKGIAKDFKKIYPKMFEDYRDLCHAGELDIGKLHFYRTENKVVLNFPTKKHWRSPSKPEYISAGLEEFCNRYINYGITSVSFPQLGTGNGELDWETQVKPIMEEFLEELPIPVFIHLYGKDKNFIPERLDAAADKQYLEEILLGREILSPSEVWQEIIGIIKNRYSLGLFDSMKLILKKEYDQHNLIFEYNDGDQHKLHADKFYEIWNTLRIQGTITIDELPESTIDNKMLAPFLEILKNLDYIREVEIASSDSSNTKTGLMYLPRSSQESPKVFSIDTGS